MPPSLEIPGLMYSLPWKFKVNAPLPGNSKVNTPPPLEIPGFLNRGGTVRIIIGIAHYCFKYLISNTLTADLNINAFM
jgi:hypothetical protein